MTHARFLFACLVTSTACTALTGTDAGSCGDTGTEANLGPGKSAAVTGISVCVPGSSTGAQYALVAFNSVATGGASATVTITTHNTATSGGLTADRQGLFTPAGGLTLPRLRRDDTQHEIFLARANRALAPLIPSARQWSASRGTIEMAAPAAPVAPGDPMQLNANTDEPCTSPEMHDGTVQAVGTRSIAVSDNANPPGGYTQLDYQSLAAQFDTLIYPLVTSTFGTPSDIDNNGKVILFFTRAVNELTPPNVEFFVGGFFFARDLFPRMATPGKDACAGSNMGEMFYLLVPDPLGTINGNARTKSFVSNEAPALLAHEFQHLVNSSRRLYVNTTAEDFEEAWLDEGLSHNSEELLFYRESGLSPRNNLGPDNLRASQKIVDAFNNDVAGNFASLSQFLESPDGNSPYAGHDSLATRGASWSFLRFAVDQKGAGDGTTWFQLTNSTVTGRATLTSVFGTDVPGLYRRWTAALEADDVTGGEDEVQLKSWQYRALFAALNSGNYPLKETRPSSGVPSTVTLVPGGSAYFRFSSGATAATLDITAPPTTLFTIVRLN